MSLLKHLWRFPKKLQNTIQLSSSIPRLSSLAHFSSNTDSKEIEIVEENILTHNKENLVKLPAFKIYDQLKTNKELLTNEDAIALLKRFQNENVLSIDDIIKASQLVFSQAEQKDIDVYNALLKTYLTNNISISSSEILDNLKKNSVIPNQLTFDLLIGSHCLCGDITSANETVELMKSYGFEITSQVVGYLAYANCVAGQLDEADKWIETCESNKEAVRYICKGLILTNQTEKLKNFVSLLKDPKVLKIKEIFDQVLIQKASVESIVSLSPLLKPIYKVDLGEFIQTSEGRKLILELFCNFSNSSPKFYKDTLKIVIRFMKDLDESRIESFLEGVQKSFPNYNVYLKVLEESCIKNPHLCLPILNLMKDHIKIKPHMILPIVIATKDPQIFQKFSQHQLDPTETPNSAFDVFQNFLTEDTNSEDVAHRYVRTAIHDHYYPISPLVASLAGMKMASNLDNFSSIIFESFIEKLNNYLIITEDFFAHHSFFVYQLKLFGIENKLISSSQVYKQLKLQHHHVAKLLLTEPTSEAATYSQNKNGFFNDYTYSLVLENKVDELKKKFETYLSAKNMIVKNCPMLIEFALLCPDPQDQSDLIDLIFEGSDQLSSEAANRLLHLKIDSGDVEGVRKIHESDKIDLQSLKNDFPIFFIPKTYLDASKEVREALDSHLLALYGDEIKNWIYYFSYMSHNRVLEARNLISKLQIAPNIFKIVHTSQHLSRIPHHIESVIDHFKEFNLFSSFFNTPTYIKMLLQSPSSFDQLQSVIESLDAHNFQLPLQIQKEVSEVFTAHGRPLPDSYKITEPQTEPVKLKCLKYSAESIIEMMRLNDLGFKIHMKSIEDFFCNLPDFDHPNFTLAKSILIKSVDSDELETVIEKSRLIRSLDAEDLDGAIKLMKKILNDSNAEMLVDVVGKIAREQEDRRILDAMISSFNDSEMMMKMLKDQLLLFQFVKRQDLSLESSHEFESFRKIAEICRSDPDAIEFLYKQVWKNCKEIGSDQHLLDLTENLMLQYTDEDVFYKNVMKIEEDDLCKLVENVLTKSLSYETIVYMDKLLHQVPFYGLESIKAINKSLLKNIKYNMFRSSDASFHESLNEIAQHHYKTVPHYLHERSTNNYLSKIKHHSIFGYQTHFSK